MRVLDRGREGSVIAQAQLRRSRYSPISTPNSTACRSAFQRASSGSKRRFESVAAIAPLGPPPVSAYTRLSDLAAGRTMRRLAAILAADVAGYSRLMGADEEGTHERLKTHLGELVNPKIAE